MVPLYALALLALSGLKAVLAGRAARAERKYARAALTAERVAKEMQAKPGNGSADPFTQAKRQYELGRLVDGRDRLEAAYAGWQARADGVGQLVAGLAGWKGRFVPYLFGVLDLGLVLAALHLLGVTPAQVAEVARELARK